MLVADDTIRKSCGACGGATALMRYEPPTGGIVPQGTRWVNITLSWTVSDDSSFREPHLWVETAADHEPRDHGAISNGETVQIEVDNTQNDLPHEVLSNWAFVLRVEPEIGSALYRFEGEVDVLVVASRGNPIPLFPPHPDLWKGTTEILMFEDEDAAPTGYSGNPNSRAGTNWLGPHILDEDVVVPYDMDHVTVTLTYGEDAPVPFTLGFHGSGTRDWTLLEPDSVSGNTYTYTIGPDQGRPDGPYAEQSLWVFEVFTDDKDPTIFIGSYTISATVYLHPA